MSCEFTLSGDEEGYSFSKNNFILTFGERRIRVRFSVCEYYFSFLLDYFFVEKMEKEKEKEIKRYRACSASQDSYLNIPLIVRKLENIPYKSDYIAIQFG